MDKNRKVLLIGYGNPGRLDDGLGPAVAEQAEKLSLPCLTVDSDYQLTVEDAAEFANYDTVVLADADTTGPEPFWMKRILPKTGQLSFTSHSVDPRSLLALAKELFKTEPVCYILGVRGYEFNEFGQRLSPGAKANLAEAVKYLEKCLRDGELKEIRSQGGEIFRQDEQCEKDNQCKTENM